jgi:pyruvate kinase
MVDHACQVAFKEEFGKAGDRLIVTAGVPFGTPGATNLLRIAYIGADGQSSTD